ncbi:DUF3164 family protein [uncultured Paraglaciecola sp.]|uniref:DUF3164 family protein n=1 Tax=uncultured Paraglaciecola sp. TaxID=1765024 RepID=UPI002607F7D0|nr:DUF3164 family protein [uncultured Paraglaciecola sp.]
MNAVAPTIVDKVFPLADKKAQNGRMEDEHGSLVIVDRIKKHDLVRDKLVRKVCADCSVISLEIQNLKQRISTEIQNLINEMLTQYGQKMGGKKGNVTLFSYDKSLKLERTQQERETTNEHILVAKQMVDDCIKAWAKGAKKDLQALVQKYFRTDGKGSYSVQDLKKLMRMKIGQDDPNWQAAMKALANSIEQSHTETYYRAYYRNEAGGYESIPLNITDVH